MPNHLVQIVMDSCRFDSYEAAATPNMDKIGKGEARYSYASWTSPSHYAMLMGMVPHTSPRGVFASEVYKQEFTRWIDRLDMPDLSFKTFVPHLSLPKVLQDLGYETIARVSMPVLNQLTGMNRFFDDYKLMGNHNDFKSMVAEVEFEEDEPRFYFFNLGETHYPYMLSGEDLPHISGVHGVFKHMDESLKAGEGPVEAKFFEKDEMEKLHKQQIRCVEYIDGLLGELIEKCPPNTHFIVTADHGELFGEDGYFGHGPIMHPKCFEIPFLEGLRPA
ncbi:sulfatase-like hydrolase/transferase [Gloeobacter morelensis]|uniref:Sulfatase-like hydrolase/transferase n=1 Tax=Gloeobacter morelensis MG652769 TaxID=2781736 RepID=A0ABY3PME1_9CYAN|nr:sulfatase-like hydrolase/transferase [Gloeobacter morelensis]UFP94821.1 sulfatase-like hydrolase/transferase [Gloeobacter morelensis MG652769]